MAWLSADRKVKGTKINLPAYGDEQDYLEAYQQAFEQHPDIKLMLLTHVSNQHGLVMPVRKIAEMAKERGIYVICDCAQSWGLIDFTIDDLGVDWAIFNLHKWIGSPVGVGALYMRQGTLSAVRPFPGEDAGDSDVSNRIHLATSNFASFMTVPDALNFHIKIGGKNKEARLRYLWESWTRPLRDNTAIEIFGPHLRRTHRGWEDSDLQGKPAMKKTRPFSYNWKKSLAFSLWSEKVCPLAAISA